MIYESLNEDLTQQYSYLHFFILNQLTHFFTFIQEK